MVQFLEVLLARDVHKQRVWVAYCFGRCGLCECVDVPARSLSFGRGGVGAELPGAASPLPAAGLRLRAGAFYRIPLRVRDYSLCHVCVHERWSVCPWGLTQRNKVGQRFSYRG